METRCRLGSEMIMNPSNYIDVFRKLVDLALEYQFRSNDLNDYEPAFLAVLRFIETADSDLRNKIDEEFVKMLQSQKCQVHELIEYCTRKMQFQKVKMCAKELIDTSKDFRTKTVMSEILKAYDKVWSGEDVYWYYRNQRI